jgi:hypothetical protein
MGQTFGLAKGHCSGRPARPSGSLGNSRGAVSATAILVITVNFLVDLIYGRLDPRIAAGR